MRACWIKLIAALPLADTTLLVENGKVEVKRGHVRSVLLSELTELCQINHVTVACINARTKSTGFKLAFYGIPEELHQRFRNVWGVHWK